MRALVACLLTLVLCASAAADEQKPHAWSAAALLGTSVRGVDRQVIGRVADLVVDGGGTIRQVLVEEAGLFGFGRRYALPFAEVQLMPALAYVAVPLTRDSLRDYAVGWRATRLVKDSWRVSELLHDHASLRDRPNIGFVRDALFDSSGQVRQVIVSTFYETYVYPFFGYHEDGEGYALPYTASEMDGLAPRVKAGTEASRHTPCSKEGPCLPQRRS
jgi:hypothetical protein